MPLLFLAACLGNLAIVTAHHNWWYGQVLPRRSGMVLHLSHGVLVLLFPAWLFLRWGLDLDGLFVPPPGGFTAAPGQALAAGYVALCAAVGLVWVPANILVRLLRRDPSREYRARVIDVAKHLGYRPAAGGLKRLVCAVPGNQVFQVELAERTLALPRLSAAWDGLTLLHLSDLHLCGTPGRDWYRFVMDRCAEWRPDLVALTGDVVDSWEHLRWVVPVLGRLRWNTAAFAILGNHDHWYDVAYVRRRLRRLGMRVPANAWEQVEVRGEPLVVVGHEGPWLRPPPDLSDCPAGPFRLCLSHTPDNVRWASRHGIDLMLSGHVHGGQVRVPLVGSILVPSRHGRRYDAGVFALGPTVLHVTRGLGGEHPLRLRCRPEAVLLTLRRP
jgi:predicted MPP superfamily phosphohydrolase